ncbi:SH3 domain-containing protein [Aureimonas sp. AU12]|uniref:SH3 domain-containing protein n=1 Tax=Aureimonas sp. AU12 TaxID=1638161 RepID=UPI00078529D3|nr:SH3 domain-containing protein [Aureimonas sp. AU12]
MTKRKPSRKAPPKPQRRIGWIWWAMGLVAIGGMALEPQRATLSRYAPSLASLLGEPHSRPASRTQASATPASARERVERTGSTTPVLPVARPERSAVSPPPRPVSSPPQRMASLAAPSPRTASIAAPPPVAPAVPTRRESNVAARPSAAVGAGAPATATPAAGRSVTRERTSLYREPSAVAPVWVTLEAGLPFRITGHDGSWRRVEAGIFTGWIKAETTVAPAPPTRAAEAQPRASHPVPRGAIPEARR